MNILYMVSWYFSIEEKDPVESFHTIAAQDLARQPGVNVAIYYPYERNLKDYMSKKEELGIVTYRSRYRLQDKIKNRLYMYRAMKQIVREFKPDLIHAHVATEAGRFAVSLGKMFHIPVIITEHSSADLSGVRSFPHHQYAYMSYGGSRYNACVSDKLTSDLKAIFPNYEFHTVYNGIRAIDNISADYSVRIHGKINMCLVAGMYDLNIKGIPVLLRALRLLADDGISYVCHFVGDGEYRQTFEDMASELGLCENVIFHGRKSQPEVYQIVSQMDFLMSTSRFESFGCTMAEAAMIGIPILATNSGGSASIVTDTNGILLEGYDAESIRDGIIEMIGRLGTFDHDAIKDEAFSRFAVESITEKYMRIYESVLHS